MGFKMLGYQMVESQGWNSNEGGFAKYILHKNNTSFECVPFQQGVSKLSKVICCFSIKFCL